MTITGAIKVLDIPDDVCLTTFRDLLLNLERYLAVEFEEDKITNVVVSNEEPDITAPGVLWYKIDNAGNFKALHVFVQGEWLQRYPAPNQLIKMFGRSDELPPGFALADENIPGISEEMADHLKETWKEIGSSGVYSVFEVVDVGL